MKSRAASSRSLQIPLQIRPERFWSRRRFLRASGLSVVGAPFVWTAAKARGQAQSSSPNGRLNHACIGVNGMGWGDLQNFLEHKRVQIVALCDVDSNNLDKAAKLFPDARLYSDWRDLLEKEGARIDSVNVTVPDHMHFSIAYSAIQKGKHVYCQKPLCHDVAEVRALTEASIKKGVFTQLGTQLASTTHGRTAVSWLREGRIGKIKHAYLCANRPGALENYRLAGPRPALGQAPPAF